MRVCVCVRAHASSSLQQYHLLFSHNGKYLSEEKKKKERKTSHKGTFAQRTVCKVLLEMSFFI